MDNFYGLPIVEMMDDAIHERLSGDLDSVSLVVWRKDIEHGNIEPALNELNKLLDTGKNIVRFRSWLDLSVYGYDDDSRELCEISDVCSYFEQLTTSFPYLFFFLNTQFPTLKAIMYCICGGQVLRKLASGITQYEIDDEKFHAFWLEQCTGLNDLFEKNNLDKSYPALNREITLQVKSYFEPEEVESMADDSYISDFLDEYLTDKGFDFTRMLDDDFMDAIRLLWEKNHYSPALKLLFIMLDTLAFVEYGDVPNAFVQWIDRYFDLRPLDVSSEELWELRNGMIHMSGSDSRKVKNNKVSRLVLVLWPATEELPVKTISVGKSLHVSRLFAVVMPKGIVNWVNAMNDKGRFVDVVKKYADTVLSMTRIIRLEQ